MRLFQKIITLLILYIATQCAFAFNISDDYTLVLTVVNKSKATLSFTGVSGTNLGNSFSINSNDILPGATAVITGTTTPETDLAGSINFTDPTGNGNVLNVIDYRQFHVGQPHFAMNNDRFISFVKSRVFNPNPNPRGLLVIAAEVDIQDKL